MPGGDAEEYQNGAVAAATLQTQTPTAGGGASATPASAAAAWLAQSGADGSAAAISAKVKRGGGSPFQLFSEVTGRATGKDPAFLGQVWKGMEEGQKQAWGHRLRAVQIKFGGGTSAARAALAKAKGRQGQGQGVGCGDIQIVDL
jgi:hypothetical protein